MNIDIRNSIKNNFKKSNSNEIFESIENAVSDKDEITLPGLGVFFELLWKEASNTEKNSIIEKIKKGLL